MAITYPRYMPSGAYQLEEFIDERSQSTSITGAGNPNVAELSPMMWRGKWRGQCRSPEERSALEAWAASLKGGLLTFRGSPVAGKYPVAHRLGWGALTVSGLPFTGIGALAATATRTNLLLRSQDFDNAAWTKDSGLSVTANATLAPDDTLTADRISASGVVGRGVYRNTTVTPGAVYTGSCWVRLATMAAADFRSFFYDNTNFAVIGTYIVPNVEVTATGWARVSASVTVPAGCTSLRYYPFRAPSTTTATFYLWGAQLELGASASAYIPTAATAVTISPAADEITISSLPDGLVLSEGDWLSFPVGSRQRMFKVTEPAISSGGQINVGIEPSRPATASNGVAVRLQDPWCDMVLTTPPSRVITNYQMGDFSFEGLQVLV